MWGMKSLDGVKTISLMLVIIFLMVILISKYSNTIMRVMVGQEVNLKTAGYYELQTDHFKIKYTAADEEYVDMISKNAEAAYLSVTNIFGQEPARNTTIVVYPDTPSLASSFGWDKNESAMGVYWAGSIRVLSPREWITSEDVEKQFVEEGPLVHEFAHLMVDEISRGNYNRWWTEGIAQYIEKKITGFEFADPFANGRQLEYYDLYTLEQKFDQLDQQVAYWESLQAAEYIVEKYGEERIFTILFELGKGNKMASAIEESLDTPYKAFEEDFYRYLQN